jgi:hypothetical protein
MGNHRVERASAPDALNNLPGVTFAQKGRRCQYTEYLDSNEGKQLRALRVAQISTTKIAFDNLYACAMLD